MTLTTELHRLAVAQYRKIRPTLPQNALLLFDHRPDSDTIELYDDDARTLAERLDLPLVELSIGMEAPVTALSLPFPVVETKRQLRLVMSTGTMLVFADRSHQTT